MPLVPPEMRTVRCVDMVGSVIERVCESE